MPPAKRSAMLTAVLDACVLYPVHLRDFLLNLAKRESFVPFWSERIRDEWIHNLLQNRPDVMPESLERTRLNMNIHFPNALVRGYESLIPMLWLPDTNDLHVFAAAIHAKAKYIVTFNLDDFPASALQPYGIEAVLPDEIVLRVIRKAPQLVLQVAKKHRQNLTRPPKTAGEYLATLEKQGLAKTVAFLREHENDI